MHDKLQALPVDLVSAVLYKAGLSTVNEDALLQVLGQAAQTKPPFSVFELHPQYKDSLVFSMAMGVHMLGGTVIRHGLTTWVDPTPRLLGKYGEKVYSRLTGDQQQSIDLVAKDLIAESVV